MQPFTKLSGIKNLTIGRLDGTGAQAMADGLVAEVLDFQQGDARDDIAVVVIRVP